MAAAGLRRTEDKPEALYYKARHEELAALNSFCAHAKFTGTRRRLSGRACPGDSSAMACTIAKLDITGVAIVGNRRPASRSAPFNSTLTSRLSSRLFERLLRDVSSPAARVIVSIRAFRIALDPNPSRA